LDLRLSERLMSTVRELLERDRTRGLNKGERKEFERYERVDYPTRLRFEWLLDIV